MDVEEVCDRYQKGHYLISLWFESSSAWQAVVLLPGFRESFGRQDRRFNMDNNAHLNSGLGKYSSKLLRKGVNKGLKLARKETKRIVINLMKQSMEEFSIRNFHKVIESLEKLLELDPDNAAAYLGLGFAQNNLEDYQGAVESFTRMIDLESDSNPLPYSQRAINFAHLRMYPEAIQDYSKAIELSIKSEDSDSKDNCMNYYNRGLSYLFIEEYWNAISDFDKAILLNRTYSMPFLKRGLAYHYLKKYAKAVKSYNKAIVLDPESCEAYYNRGLAYERIEKHLEAVNDYTRAIQLMPTDAGAYERRGSCRYFLDDEQGAIVDLHTAANLFIGRGDATSYARVLKYTKQIC